LEKGSAETEMIMFYDRKIKYLDYYENDERIRGTGFIKLEARDGMLRIEVTVTGLHATDSFIRDVMICGPKQDSVVGRIRISGGRGQYRQLCQNLNDIEGTGIGYGELRGLRIPLGGNRELSCIWQEKREPAEGAGQEEIRVAEKGGENRQGSWKKESHEMAAGQRNAGSMGMGALERDVKQSVSVSWGQAESVRESPGGNQEMAGGEAENIAGRRGQAQDVRESPDGNQEPMGGGAEGVPDSRGQMRDGRKDHGREQKMIGDETEDPAGNDGQMRSGRNALGREQELMGEPAESYGRMEDGHMSLYGNQESIAVGQEAVQGESREMGDVVRGLDKKRGGIGEAGQYRATEDYTSADVGTAGRGAYASEKNGEMTGHRTHSSGKGGESAGRGIYASGKNEETEGHGRQASEKNGRVIGQGEGGSGKSRDIINNGQDTSGRDQAMGHRTENSGTMQGASGSESREGRGGTAKQPVKLLEDKWQQLCVIYPHINPFHDKREYLSIGPSDFVLFPAAAYKMVNNSFLLHGYYNYRHLILTRVERKGESVYYIGVPGNYFEKEKQVAIMFGFESFECEEEPAQTGDFGYYMMRTEL